MVVCRKRACQRENISALLNLVALCCTHGFIISWTEAGAGGGWCTCVTGSNRPLVGQVGRGERALPTSAKKEDSHFDAIAAHLHCRLAEHIDKLICKVHARIQVTLSSTISKDRLTLDIRLLVDVQLGLAQQSICTT